MTEQDLKKKLLVIGGLIDPSEAISKADVDLPLQSLVDVMVSQCHDSPVRLALLATSMARYIAENSP
jgi:hypothetical protein